MPKASESSDINSLSSSLRKQGSERKVCLNTDPCFRRDDGEKRKLKHFKYLWQKKHSITVAGLEPRDIWNLWANTTRWSEFDKELEYTTEPQGGFRVGSWFYLKPKGGPKVKIVISE